MVLSLPPKLRQQFRGGSGLGADEGGDVDGALMDAGKVFAAEQADGEGGGEGVAGADGIHDSDLRGGLLVVLSFVPDERARGTAGEGDGVQISEDTRLNSSH